MSALDEEAFYTDLAALPGITHQDKQYSYLQTLTADRNKSQHDLRILNAKQIRTDLMQPADVV